MVGLRKHAAVLSFAFIAAFSMLSPKEANAQFGFDSRTGHHYRSNGSLGNTWHLASLHAQHSRYFGRPGYLATIKDATENGIVQAVTDFNWTVFARRAQWLGGFDVSLKHNKWQWVTDDLFTYTNWYPGEPNGPTTEPALEMLAETGGLWNDIPYNYTGGNRGYGVYEYEPSQVTLLSLTGPTTINSPRAVNYTVTLAAPAPPGGAILFLHSSMPAIAAVLPTAITIPGGSSSLVVPLLIAQTVAPNQVGYVRVYGKNKKSLNVTVTP